MDFKYGSPMLHLEANVSHQTPASQAGKMMA
jgi:hypothetical protein